METHCRDWSPLHALPNNSGLLCESQKILVKPGLVKLLSKQYRWLKKNYKNNQLHYKNNNRGPKPPSKGDPMMHKAFTTTGTENQMYTTLLTCAEIVFETRTCRYKSSPNDALTTESTETWKSTYE
ncbi:hypothetical protein E2542_SST15397 [Spatholobus suberectus]|nr:hypothetical protein E2542_SST15397 [Spatholobus suberectus]